ncbi:MAG: ammonium transporter [Rhodocyclales bacterium]|nr:ammonium transporter [Rhodocyclales bacterium]MDB5888547.1 ammonium transporter [Rhodocyclales bacterium]
MHRFRVHTVLRCLVLLCLCGVGAAWGASFPATRIVFESGKTDLAPDALAAINAIGVFLTETPGAEVTLVTAADPAVPEQLTLAQQRLASISDSLKLAGASEPHINLVTKAQTGKDLDVVELSAAGAVTAAASEPVAAPVIAAPEAASAPAVLTAPGLVTADKINSGDTAWMLTSTALVLLMTIPGLALFYAGMVRKKNVLATMMQSLAITCLVTILWWVCGYSLAFTPGPTPYLGGFERVLMNGMVFMKEAGKLSVSHLAPTIPETVYAMYQLTFAIITPALICGAFAERMKFSAMLWFMALWSLIVYAPVAHWMWEPSGWLAARGMLDFAGGTVVHVNAGIAALACVVVLGPRIGYGKEAMPPHNLTLTIMGAALLWVGWFGFNAGSAVAADGRAGMAMAATQLATASAALTWMFAEWLVNGKPSVLGIATGAVAGLVAITPASGFVDPNASIIIGAVGSFACYLASTWFKRRFGYDDSLDVFGVHCIGGAVGALLTGTLVSRQISGVDGNMVVQLMGVGATLVYSFVMSWIILQLIDKTLGLRVPLHDEQVGLDISLHGEQVM